ncbi:MAG: hypothetical protein EBZ26_03850, partial [Flavobacteriia bacterium]|nr:hypothetical protein [Flavobacteriia bacterium]
YLALIQLGLRRMITGGMSLGSFLRRAFCAGLDMGNFGRMAETPKAESERETTASDVTEGLASRTHGISNRAQYAVWTWREAPVPVIAAVNGVAAGAGANIALACDIVVASEHASFIQAFSKIGLIPDSGGTWTLPRLVGFQRASALMMTGDKVGAAEAQSMGMIYKVFAADTFGEQVTALAEQMAQMPTKGLALTKAALNASGTNDMRDQLSLEETLQTEAGQTYDFNEGVQAFLEKRAPKFKGQ